MALVNTPKPSAPSLTNTVRVNIAELWSTITTSWSSETRSWGAMASLLVNTTKASSSGMTNTAKPS